MTIQPTGDFVPVEKFGKDHWSTLMYIETRCTDYNGILSNNAMRCNVNTHRELLGTSVIRSTWDEKHGTRLNDGTVLPQHDDWDCLHDLINVGYVVQKKVSPLSVALTPQGEAIAYRLRSHKAHGGRLASFKLVNTNKPVFPLPVETARDLDRYPFYEISKGTAGEVIREDEDTIVVRVLTEGDSRLAGHINFTYTRTGRCDELHFPYERFSEDWASSGEAKNG